MSDTHPAPRRLAGRSKTILLVAGVLVLAGALVFANLRRGRGGGGPAVSVVTAKKEPIATTVLATGKLEAVGSQQLYAETGGVLTTVNVKEGDHVKPGEVLASFDTSGLELQREQDEAAVQEQKANLAGLQATLAEDRIALTQDQAALARTAALAGAGAATRVALADARAKVQTDQARDEAARAQVASAQAQLQSARVTVRVDRHDIAESVFTADRNGTVLLAPYKEGGYVSAGSRVMVIGTPGHLKVEAWVDESDSAGLKPGLPVRFSCPALPDQQFPARITLVSPAATDQNPMNGGQSQTATGPAVEIAAVPTGKVAGLRPGYTADLTITTAHVAEAVVVPFDAIVKNGSQEEVFVVQNGIAVARTVRTGVSNDLDVQVTGLKAGEQVIEKPPPGLAGGDPVTVRRTAG